MKLKDLSVLFYEKKRSWEYFKRIYQRGLFISRLRNHLARRCLFVCLLPASFKFTAIVIH
jgi:hypothetical protein